MASSFGKEAPFPAPQSHKITFDPFEVDLRSGELRKNGHRIRLQPQPFQLLSILLENPGEVVTREEIRQKLWPDDTFVDFDHSLAAAVNKIREALSDSAENPKFVETLSKRGYRFVALIHREHLQVPPTQTAKLEAEGTAPAPESTITNFSVWPGRRTWILLGAVATFLLVLAWAKSRPHVESAAPTLTPVPATTYPGVEYAPSFSPDGNELAFGWIQSSAPGAADLYVKQIGQEHAIRLTNHHARSLKPAWSPDGRSIAFSMLSADGNGIYVMPALGGPERLVANLGENNILSYISWSADNKRIAFAKADSPTADSRIHVVDVETTKEKVLPPPSPDCLINIEPTFSPDGKSLAYVCFLIAGAGNKIYVQPSDGNQTSEVSFIAGPAFLLDGITWTADSRTLIYSAEGNLYRVNAKGGTPEKLLFAHDASSPAVSLSGNRLAYVQANDHPDIWRIDLEKQTKAASTARKFITSTRGQMNPQISPDGKHIVFESWRSGNHEIWIADVDGENLVQLSFFGDTLTGTPHWSPDSHRIAFDSRVSGPSQIYIVRVDGGAPQKLQTSTLDAGMPFWSSDGKWIYFSGSEPEAVWKAPSQGGKAVRLTNEGYDPQESADGKRVFYVVGRGPSELRSVSADGSDDRQEITLRNDTHWTPVPNGIYYIDNSRLHSSINFLDLSSQRLHKIAELQDMAIWGGISLSRDGHTLLFSAVDDPQADIMLVNGFR